MVIMKTIVVDGKSYLCLENTKYELTKRKILRLDIFEKTTKQNQIKTHNFPAIFNTF